MRRRASRSSARLLTRLFRAAAIMGLTASRLPAYCLTS